MLPVLALSMALAACSHQSAKQPEPVRRTASAAPTLLSPEEFEALPLRSFRTDDPKKNDEAALQAFKDIGHKDAEFLHYMYLFPAQFRLAGKKLTARLTDELTKKIFESETGRVSLCFLTSAEEKFTSYYLGVSKALAKDLRKTCAPYNQKLTDAQKHMFRNMRSTLVPGTNPSQRQKRMVFVISESGPMDIEAYSTRENTTLFFLERGAFTEANLVRVLAHELAMSYDQLTRAGHNMNIETWQDGMAVIFGLPLFSPQGGYSTYFKKTANEQAVYCALNDLPVKYALATERAFRFEDQISRELGLDNLTLGGANLSCEENVRRWLPAVPAYTEMIDFDLNGAVIYLESKCGETLDGRPVSEHNDHLMAEVQRQGGKAIKDLPKAKQQEYMERRKEAFIRDSKEHTKLYKQLQDRLLDPSDPNRRPFLAERIATLKNTTLEPKNGSAPQNLCEFLLSPRVGARHTGFLGGGPRPRAGGWEIKGTE
jgi:hypothetical protein